MKGIIAARVVITVSHNHMKQVVKKIPQFHVLVRINSVIN